MRIPIISESDKYYNDRQLKNENEYRRKKDKKEESLSFSDMLKRAQQNTYLNSNQ